MEIANEAGAKANVFDRTRRGVVAQAEEKAKELLKTGSGAVPAAPKMGPAGWIVSFWVVTERSRRSR
jgi:hypothetical protein